MSAVESREADPVAVNLKDEFVQSCASGNLVRVKELLDAKADPNLSSDDGVYVYLLPLHAAAMNGKLPVLNALLEAKVDVNAISTEQRSWDGAMTNTIQETALCIASKKRNPQTPVEVVQALLAAGADPNVRCSSEYDEMGAEEDPNYYTALDFANNK